MTRLGMSSLGAAMLLVVTFLGPPPALAQLGSDYARQGWSEAQRRDFYCQDQGSRVMPLAWLRALEKVGGGAFLANGLGEYGYLSGDPCGSGLPIGFTTSGAAGSQWVGMNCAACHTREITHDGKPLRIDGAPAISDFYAFSRDLHAATGATLADASTFDRFARQVLGAAPLPADVAQLRTALQRWHERFDALMSKQTKPWGLGRLDAIGMILNRVTGLDLGGIRHDNIKTADAPTRYPFLWYSPQQDHTQWLGFAQNGNDLLALARNAGQVLGVFGEFQIDKIYPIGFRSTDSINFSGLGKLEDAIKQLRPPPWPGKRLDPVLVRQGKDIFNSNQEAACASCHGVKPGAFRGPEPTRKTTLRDVNTDTRAGTYLSQVAESGTLKDAWIPAVSCGSSRTAERERAMLLLNLAVAGSILQVPFDSEQAMRLKREKPEEDLASLKYLRRASGCSSTAPAIVYEGRTLEGIWATAPYLHNGSVPTLQDLLSPVASRPITFQMGSDYDLERVGIATVQRGISETRQLTDCRDRNSGNSNCGHVYGTKLSQKQKTALLEYLKSL